MVVLILSVLFFMLKGVVFCSKGVGFLESCCDWIGCFCWFRILVVVIMVDERVVGFYVGYFVLSKVERFVMWGVVIFVFEIMVKCLFIGIKISYFNVVFEKYFKFIYLFFWGLYFLDDIDVGSNCMWLCLV